MTPGLDDLLPARFLDAIPFEQLRHVPRFLKAMQIRAERARLNRVKDQERANQLTFYLSALQKMREAGKRSLEDRQRAESFRWMIEEFKVSLFAQELGTAIPVSPKRLDQFLASSRS
jgi:ATP-dependent helicase HrpA